MSHILITGGTGLIGSYLSRKLLESGHHVSFLSRSAKLIPGVTIYQWNPEKGEMDPAALISADHIVHLAGANIGEKRWKGKRKQEIIDSRVRAANLIFNEIKKTSSRKPQSFISASAIGYYGALTSDHIFTETDPSANDFLGRTCQSWEDAADQFRTVGMRVVKIRTGVVLAKDGGALTKMILPVKMGIGSAIGTGRQYLPWIHIDDLCEIYIKAIKDINMIGTYNAVAPDHETNHEFMSLLARKFKKPFWFPAVPPFIMKLIFGEMSEMLLEGSRVSPEKVMNSGYKFKFTQLAAALENLLK